MFFFGKQSVKRPRQKGNSLTFLMGSMAVMSLSLSVTTVVMGPMTTKEITALSQIDGVEQVADHHLDKIELYVKEHQNDFINPQAWTGNYAAIAIEGLPEYQLLNKSSDAASGLTSLATMSETMRVKDMGSPIPINSRILTDTASNLYFYRGSQAPYQNTIKVKVEALAGTNRILKARTITLAPEQCATEMGLPGMPVYNIPYVPQEDDPAVLGTSKGFPLNVNAQHFPYFQAGSNRICRLPENGQATNTDLWCRFSYYNINLVTTSRGTINDAYGTRYNVASMFSQVLEPTGETYKLYLDVNSDNGTTPTSLFKESLSIGVAGSGKKAKPDDIQVMVIPPKKDYYNNPLVYKALILYRTPQDSKMNLTWARWDQSQIYAEGIFDTTGIKTLHLEDSWYGTDFNVQPFGAAPVDTFTLSPGIVSRTPINNSRINKSGAVVVATQGATAAGATQQIKWHIYSPYFGGTNKEPIYSCFATGSTSVWSSADGNNNDCAMIEGVWNKVRAPYHSLTLNGSDLSPQVYDPSSTPPVPDHTNSAIANMKKWYFYSTPTYASSTNRWWGRGIASGTYIQAFGKPVISSDNQFALIPAVATTGTSGSAVVVLAVNLNTQSYVNASNVESQRQDGVLPGGASNVVSLMAFNGSVAVDGDGMIEDNDPTDMIVRPDEMLSKIRVFYRPDVNKFYWVANNFGGSRYLYEWDPRTWGKGTLQGSETAERQNLQTGGTVETTSCSLSNDIATIPTGPYTGFECTVRRYRAPEEVWQNVNAAPQVSVDATRSVLYLRDVDDVFQFNLVSGAVDKLLPAVTPFTTSTPATGRTMSLDSTLGLLYFSEPYYGLMVRPTQAAVTTAATAVASTANLFAERLTKPNSGDGGLIYSPYNNMLYYLDVPSSVTSTTRPKLYGFRPACSSYAQTSNRASSLGGFTGQTQSFSSTSLEGVGNAGSGM